MCELYPFTDGETEAQADENPMQEFVPMGEAEGVFFLGDFCLAEAKGPSCYLNGWVCLWLALS